MNSQISPPNSGGDGQTIIGIGLEFLCTVLALIIVLISSGMIVYKIVEDNKIHIIIKIILFINILLLLAIFMF